MGKSATSKALDALVDKVIGMSVTELPEVAAKDNGKVLTVSDEGEWEAAALPE